MAKSKPKRSEEKATSELLFAIELQRQGLLDEAERFLLDILKTRRKDWRMLRLLSEVYLARSDYIQALKFMAAAMKANPGAAKTEGNYGFILQKLERHDEALIYFNRALVAAPNNISALLNRGISLYQLNRPTEALASFDRVLALEPKKRKRIV
jgi:protein O-GlcNAc transferase